MPERLTDRRIAALKPRDGQYHLRQRGHRPRDQDLSERPQGVRVRLARARHASAASRSGSFPAGPSARRAPTPVAPAAEGRHRRERRARTRRARRRPDRAVARHRPADAAAGHGEGLSPPDRQRTSCPHFGKADPRALTRNGIIAWHGGIAQKTPVDANRALAVLSAFLSWLRARRQGRAQLRQGREAAGRKASARSSSMPTRSRPPMRRSTRTAIVPPRWRCGCAC